VMERTFRAGLGISGGTGPFELQADMGFHHVINSGHVEGRTTNRFEGRLQATLGLTRGGVLR
jgi:hypothetical protein